MSDENTMLGRELSLSYLFGSDRFVYTPPDEPPSAPTETHTSEEDLGKTVILIVLKLGRTYCQYQHIKIWVHILHKPRIYHPNSQSHISMGRSALLTNKVCILLFFSSMLNQFRNKLLINILFFLLNSCTKTY